MQVCLLRRCFISSPRLSLLLAICLLHVLRCVAPGFKVFLFDIWILSSKFRAPRNETDPGGARSRPRSWSRAPVAGFVINMKGRTLYRDCRSNARVCVPDKLDCYALTLTRSRERADDRAHEKERKERAGHRDIKHKSCVDLFKMNA